MIGTHVVVTGMEFESTDTGAMLKIRLERLPANMSTYSPPRVADMPRDFRDALRDWLGLEAS